MDGGAGAASDDEQLSPAALTDTGAGAVAGATLSGGSDDSTLAAGTASGGPEDEDQVVSEGPRISRREQHSEWLAQFIHSPSSFHARALHRTIDERGLRESLGLRGVYWRLFLHILDRHDLKAWARQITEEREKYEQLAKSLRVHIRRVGTSEEGGHSEATPAGQRSRSNSSLSADSDAPALDLRVHNPLSLSNPFAADNELSETIKHDLHRTHADRALFCSSRVQDLMFNVLFIWSKTESTEEKGRYRQGMNEILSPIVLVLMRESQSRDGWDIEEEDQEAAVDVGAAGPNVEASPLAASIDDESPAFSPPAPVERSAGSGAVTGDESLLPLLLDSRYVEHDVYALFVRVMHAMAPFFQKIDTAPRSSLAAAAKKRNAGLGNAMGPALGDRSAGDENPVDASPIVRKCNYIHHVLLSTIDPQLYTHLNRQDVAPTLYILRWYRVMFSREFVRTHAQCRRSSCPRFLSLLACLLTYCFCLAVVISVQHMEDTLLLWDVMFATTERSAVSGPSSGGAAAAAVSPSAVPDSSFKRALTPKSPDQPSGGQSGQGFLLAEYIVIAMLLYVRQALMHGDNSYCLRRLLRYPPVEDVRVLLARALHFHNGWRALTADPTLTRESWNPTATDHDSVLAPRGLGVGSGVGGVGHVPEGTTNPEAFQGPWQTISGGDMGADAPLEPSPESGSRGGTRQHLPQQSQGSRSSAQQSKRGSQSGSGGSGKTLFSDSFASLKSFMKGTLQKAAELPAHPPPASERTGSQSKQPSPSPTNASKPAAGSVASRGSVGSGSGSRKAPTSSGVSHFLSSSASPPAPSSSSSPTPSYSPIVNGPSAAQHDELILLRKQLALREKEVASLSASLYGLNQQLQDARTIQTQMGNLLAQSIEEMEREYARSQGEHLANEDGDDEETAENSSNNNSSNSGNKNDNAADKAEADEATKTTENGAVDPSGPTGPEASAVVASDSTDVDPASAVSAPPAASAPPSSSPATAVPSKRRPFSEDVLLSGLAEFKHVRDVLVGRLTLPDIIDYLHTTTAAAAATATNKDNSKPDNGDASVGVHSSRQQILSDISSMHARQLESSRQSAKDGSQGGGGAGFPYNLPPPKPRTFTPLFETEVAPRDKVSELFALDESDAVPGVYPTVHKVTAQPPLPAQATGPLQNVSALSTAAALGALSSSSTSPLHANSNATSRIVDPLVSPRSAAAVGAKSQPTAGSAPAPAVAPTASSASAPSAAASSLLSGLLSSPTAGAASASGSSAPSSKSSLFGTSPPSSPPFAALSTGGAASRVRTGMFGDDDDDSPFPNSASSKLSAASGANKKKPGVFSLEEEDDSILLPSASQFKEPPRSFKPAPKKPVAAAATPAAAAAPAPAAGASKPAASSSSTSTSAPAGVRVTSPLHVSPSPTVASSTKSVAPEEDPLSWMGTGGK